MDTDTPPPVELPLRLEYLDPEQLTDNPANWRLHPAGQLSAINDAIREVGWAGALLYNEQSRRLLDGHGRKAVPKELWVNGRVPVLVGRWTEEQERYILRTLDPLGQLAEVDAEKLDELLADLPPIPDEVDSLLRARAEYAHAGELKPDEGDGRPNRSELLDQHGMATVVTCVLPCSDVALFERAITATGEINRAEALKMICDAYLKGKT